MKSHLSAQCHPPGSSQLSACQLPYSLPRPFCSRPSQAHPSPYSLFTGSLAQEAGFIVYHPCHTCTYTQHPCRRIYTLSIAAAWDCLESRKFLPCLPKSELIRAKEKSGPAYVLESSLVQPLSIQTASFVVWGDKGS